MSSAISISRWHLPPRRQRHDSRNDARRLESEERRTRSRRSPASRGASSSTTSRARAIAKNGTRNTSSPESARASSRFSFAFCRKSARSRRSPSIRRPPQTAALFETSFDRTLDEYRHLLADETAHRLVLEDRDFDTGKPTRPGEYRLADDTYAKLARKLAEKDPAAIDPALLKNVLDFYRDLATSLRHQEDPEKTGSKPLAALDKLRTQLRRADRISPLCHTGNSAPNLPRMFAYSQNDYYCEQVPLADLAHHDRNSGLRLFQPGHSARTTRAYTQAFGALPHTVCYAVKANSSLAILALLAKAGAGFDIVSGGELYRVLQAGGDPSKVVFSGVGKTAAEVEYALESGIHSFNCESEAELALIDAKAARLGKKAGFSIRVNPDVDAVTHPYISTGLSQHKFGIAIAGAAAVYERSRQFRNLVAEGVSCHIGSQILDPSPILEAVDKVLALANRLRAQGHPIRHLDLGGGLGVAYHAGEKSPEIGAFVEMLSSRMRGQRSHRHDRTRTQHRRPGRRAAHPRALPQAQWRQGIPDRGCRDERSASARRSIARITRSCRCARAPLPPVTMDVVGPVCETGDFLARDREHGQCHARRFPGDLHRRSLRLRAEFELQLAPARAGGAGGRRHLAHHPAAGDLRTTWSAAKRCRRMSNPFGTDEMAAGYATSRPPVHPRVIEQAFDNWGAPNPFERALDVGCGAGVSTRALDGFANSCVGLEPAEAMLRWAATSRRPRSLSWGPPRPFRCVIALWT